MGETGTGGPNDGVRAVLHTSVATFYSNLVTRPAGQAVRVAIEDQLREAQGTSLSILDFSHVGVIDFSCADEVIAKLLRKYMSRDRPSEAFFVVQGVSRDHRDLIETVLQRQNLLLVALEDGRPALWGPAPVRLRWAWHCLGELGQAVAHEFASARGLRVATAASWLKRLASWRLAVPDGGQGFASLPAVLARGMPPDCGRVGPTGGTLPNGAAETVPAGRGGESPAPTVSAGGSGGEGRPPAAL